MPEPTDLAEGADSAMEVVPGCRPSRRRRRRQRRWWRWRPDRTTWPATCLSLPKTAFKGLPRTPPPRPRRVAEPHSRGCFWWHQRSAPPSRAPRPLADHVGASPRLLQETRARSWVKQVRVRALQPPVADKTWPPVGAYSCGSFSAAWAICISIWNRGGRCCPLLVIRVVQAGHSGRVLARLSLTLVATGALWFWRAAAGGAGCPLLVSAKTAANRGHARPHRQTWSVDGGCGRCYPPVSRPRRVRRRRWPTLPLLAAPMQPGCPAPGPSAFFLHGGVGRSGRRRHRAGGGSSIHVPVVGGGRESAHQPPARPPQTSSPPLWRDPRVSVHRLSAGARECLLVLGSVPPARLGSHPPSFILPSAGTVPAATREAWVSLPAAAPCEATTARSTRAGPPLCAPVQWLPWSARHSREATDVGQPAAAAVHVRCVVGLTRMGGGRSVGGILPAEAVCAHAPRGSGSGGGGCAGMQPHRLAAAAASPRRAPSSSTHGAADGSGSSAVV